VRGLGLPVRFILTAGQRNDITQAKALIDRLPAQWVLGDTAFDADHFRHRRHQRPRRHSVEPVTGPETATRRAPLQGKASGRMLFLKAQALSPYRHPLREDRQELPRHHHHGGHRSVAKMTVNRA